MRVMTKSLKSLLRRSKARTRQRRPLSINGKGDDLALSLATRQGVVDDLEGALLVE